MGLIINLTIITKNHAADQEIGFFAKSISKSNGCATALPTAWELEYNETKIEEHTAKISSLRNLSLLVNYKNFYIFILVLQFTNVFLRSASFG